ncbi:MAG: YidH family protein [Nocardioidaceae bacterium]
MPEGASDGHVDYRFLLANERTFLAYVRTALALQIAGLGVMQFLTKGHDVLRLLLGLALILVGSYVGLAGYLRWRDNERSIRAGHEMHTSRSASVITVAVVVVPLVAAVILAVL